MRRFLAACVIGFLAGAANLAGGEDAAALREELARLQAAAAGLARRPAAPVPDTAAVAAERPLAILPVEDLSAPRPDSMPPAFPFEREDEERFRFGDGIEERASSLGTEDAILTLAGEALDPAAREDAWLASGGGALLIHGEPAVARAVERFLEEAIRPQVHAGVVVEVEAYDRPEGALDAARVRTGPCRLALRGAGTLGTRFHVWCGREVALLADAEVEMASGAWTTDPFPDAARTGALLVVRATAAGARGAIQLDLDVRSRDLASLGVVSTVKSGAFDQPTFDVDGAHLSGRVPAGRWIVAAAGTRRVFVVRARLRPRGSGS